MKKIVSSLFLFAFIAAAGGGCASSGTARPGENERESLSAANQALLAEADRFEKDGRHEEALELYVRLAARGGKEKQEALFRKAELLYESARYEEALEAYDAVLRLQPGINRLRYILNRKYDIGMLYIRGKATCSFLGLFSYASETKGIKVLDQLIRDYPYHERSDEALLNIANYYYDDGSWEEAEPVYEQLLKSYPDSEWVPEAYKQLGMVTYNMIKGYRYDPLPIRRARWYFEQFLERRKIGKEAQEAREYIRRLREMESRYELYVAQFYEGDDNPKGARIYLESAVKRGTSPSGERTEAAVEAAALLRELDNEEDNDEK